MATFSGGQSYDPDKAGNINLPDVPQAQLSTPIPIEYTNWGGTLGGGPTGGQPDPYDLFRMTNEFTRSGMKYYPAQVQMQLGMLPQITAAQMAASQQAFPMQLQQQNQAFQQQLAQQTEASQAAYAEQMRQYGIAAPQIAAQNFALQQQYQPKITDLLRSEQRRTDQQLWEQATGYNPEFYPAYHALGGRISEGLAAGYDLGTDLEREVQQGIRGAQAARGNYLGPAPTAAEAYGLGHAATDLYNTRIGQAQNFIQGRTPSDVMMSMLPGFGPGGTAMGMVGQTAQPGVGLISPVTQPGQVQGTAGLAATSAANFLQNPIADYTQQGIQGYQQYMGALGTYAGQSIQGQTGYNTALIQSAAANNEGTFNMYDKQFEQFLFDQSVKQGIYSQPTLGGAGSSSGMMGMVGSGLGAIGSIGGSLLAAPGAAAGIGGAVAGVGTAVAGGAAAVGTGIATAAAAAGSAAAICWLARAVLPSRWKEVRQWLFTKAPDYFRRAYVYGARRFVARGLAKADKVRIAEVLKKCL